MLGQTHRERLKKLGEKIMNTGGKCNKYSGKMQTDCEKIGLLMIQPVLSNLLKMKTEIKSLNSKFKTVEDKKKFIQNIFINIKKTDSPNIKTMNTIYGIKNEINDSFATQIFDIFNKLNDDTIDALYILSTIISNKYNFNEFFIKNTIDLMLKILNNESPIYFIDKENLYGGGWYKSDIFMIVIMTIVGFGIGGILTAIDTYHG